mmetsp:Transcript_9507/g.10444  ORF Transcript_9507/g.10444 Transcript_9507/m.10444 type:complete len:80 (+) Transcript_9507:302-541(+)
MQLEDFNPGSQKNEKSDFFGERELQSNPGSDGFSNGDLVVRVQPIMASANLVYFSFVIFFLVFEKREKKMREAERKTRD